MFLFWTGRSIPQKYCPHCAIKIRRLGPWAEALGESLIGTTTNKHPKKVLAGVVASDEKDTEVAD
jgi:hypothetical protein